MGINELKRQLEELQAACAARRPDIAAIRSTAENLSVNELDADSYRARKLRGLREESIFLDPAAADFEDRLMAIRGDIRMLLASLFDA